MKKLLLWLGVLGLPRVVLASQLGFLPDNYFRFVDYAHPAPVLGALIAPEKLGDTEAGSLLPIFTHSPKDGCLFPSVVCEDWSPLALGASMNAGKITFDAGPLMNVLPWMQRGASAIVPDNWASIHRVLAYNPDQAVTFSAGPLWEYKQITNKGYLRLFTGLSLHF